MANNYHQSAFAIKAKPTELELLDRILDLDFNEPIPPELDALFEGGLMSIWEDPDFPETGFNHDGGGYFGADEANDVDALCRIIRATCPSALPFGFSSAFTCDKLRPDEFGGAWWVVSKDGVDGGSTYYSINEALREVSE